MENLKKTNNAAGFWNGRTMGRYDDVARRCRVFWTAAAAVLSGLFVLSCGDDTSQTSSSSLATFAFSDCKDGAEGLDKIIPEYIALYTMQDSTNLEGLECVSWKHDGNDMLKIDLINFTNGCLPEWDGDAAATNGAVSLVVENPMCGMGACGNCIYDWSFEVNDVPAGENVDLSIDVWSYPREGCEMTDPEDALNSYGLDISAANLDAGMVCRYVRPMDLEWLSKIGEAYTPCTEEGTCEPGLVCVPHPQSDVYTDDTLCLTSCTVDADCPNTAVEICGDGGVCVLGNVWVP